MKTPITFLLCLSLLALPFEASAPEQSPPPDNNPPSVLVACVVIVVGAVIVYGLWKLCKKIPGPPPKDGPPPPPAGTNTNSHAGKASWVMPRLIMPDTDLAPVSDWQVVVGSFQSSSNCSEWATHLFVTNWISDAMIVCVASDLNGPLATNWFYGPFTNNQQVISDFGNLQALLPQDDRKFYRMVELP